MNTMLKAACLAALAAPALVQAQAYPARPITIVIPTGPGGGTSTEVKVWTDLLSANLGQPFVTDFKPGANTALGLNFVSKSKPDGYILGATTINYPLTPLRFKEPPFDPIKDFAHVSLLNKRFAALMISSELPVNNVKEFIAYAKANPDKLNWSASGEGSLDHVVGTWLMSATGTKFNFIHYKNSNSATADLLAGRVQLTTTSISQDGSYLTYIKSGKLRNIGTAALQRSPLAPDIPTLHEQGVKDYEVPSFLGVVAPPNTPAAVINRLYGEIVKVSKTPELQKGLGPGSLVLAASPAEFRKQLTGYTERFRQLAKDHNIDMTAE